jgi:hypothetical protein
MRWLTWLGTVNLIDVLTYYLLLAFAVSTLLRMRNYRTILGLVFTFPNRWPKLLALVKQHRTIFLRWPAVLPVGLTLALMLANTLASHFVWSQARVTWNDLWERWFAFVCVIAFGGTMLYLDFYAIFNFGHFNRAALEANLDKAEHWMQTWKAPVVHILTFGLVNPRKIVNDQVRKALIKASMVVNGQMWRWSLQIGMRLAVGITLWITWACSLYAPA